MPTDSNPSLWDFDHFVCKWTHGDTFAYWACTLERNAELPTVIEIGSAMTMQCDFEEQTPVAEGFQRIHPLSPSPLMPVAPVTMAKNWSPFPLATNTFGDPVNAFIDKDDHRAMAYAVWPPIRTGINPASCNAASEEHFLFLASLANEKAHKQGLNLFLFGTIGWSFDHELECPINEESVQAMLDFGFLYPQRMMR